MTFFASTFVVLCVMRYLSFHLDESVLSSDDRGRSRRQSTGCIKVIAQDYFFSSHFHHHDPRSRQRKTTKTMRRKDDVQDCC